MSTQITVRLPDDLVSMVDTLVSSGRARSRASVVERALERELRRELAARDVAILQGRMPDDGMDALAAWAQSRSID
ncbi:ribbon-helix-helix protein, CopG family [Cellulomonas sp. JH27-2]|uniref:ribbon-helix-helix domain-containing protein n=1 Tax=Cellulomonas sp. JH27-2 TaxID=2774139 RepID=UPI00177C0D93|nr:ribbon-helix-helix domain-containing protein [Cellulomonas sp. JH27-2]MBD8057674.1 ribbon-helix-helix protein, CopG family [Cellulomonas sp. JH27-2]